MKTIAVVGGTGAQGGGLVRAILADRSGGFRARVITRDPNGAAAQALQARGAEVVPGDVDDVESLKRAMAGAYGAFMVTPFWAHLSADRELAQVENLARAAKASKLEHAIWSTLEDSRAHVRLEDDRMPTLQGRYKVPHYDAKAEGDELFRKLAVPTTFLRTSFYWDNLIHFGMQPKRGPDGVLRFVLPMGQAKLPGIAAEDIGKCAHAIFKLGPSKIGETHGIAGEHLSGAELALKLSAALGEPVLHESPEPHVFRSFGFPGADDLGNMFQWQRDFESAYRASRSVAATRALNPELLSFDAWLAKHVGRLPIEARAA